MGSRTAEFAPAAAREPVGAQRSTGGIVQRFAGEISELRALGFAESLPMHVYERAADVVARLESGRIGVAVEFRVDVGLPRYAVKPLIPDAGPVMATDIWGEIVKDIRRRTPLSDDE